MRITSAVVFCLAFCLLGTVSYAQPPSKNTLKETVIASKIANSGAKITKSDGIVEITVVTDERVETTQTAQLRGSRLPKRYKAIECKDHKKIVITNVAIHATKGAALMVSGKCQVTLKNSYLVSDTGPAIVIKGKRAKVTLESCSVRGAKGEGKKDKTYAAQVGRRATLDAKDSYFHGRVKKARRKDFKKKNVLIHVPEGEKKLRASR